MGRIGPHDKFQEPIRVTTRPVLLLHGLWMRSLALVPLARRLRAHGFDCRRFDYPTIRGGPGPAVERLCAELRRQGEQEIDLVAHSLGGLVALQALRCAPEVRVRRVVCLGSPLRGSRAAALLAGWPIGPLLLGASGALLREGLPAWDGGAEIGMIAGCTPVGMGRLVGGLPLPHDGTVCLEETALPGLADRIVLATTHSSMLFSAAVAAQVAAFLRDGRFEHPGIP
jgi:pimeloyl-ACP methyl ester carboxylesterase